MAVYDMHSSFAIHRNISPSNLYIDPEKAILSNMKDAIFLVNDKQYRTTSVGAELYQAPEVYN